jgi:hypothetical protein
MTIPTPEPGLVINYAYRWHHPDAAEQEGGHKDRPAVIVLCAARNNIDATVVTVLPIAHSPPSDPRHAVEIPEAIKRHLGLGEAPLWIVAIEGNDFIWPGHGLKKLPDLNRYDYGFLPPLFFGKVIEALAVHYDTGKARRTASYRGAA